jgi:hypothetical protein
MITRRLREAIDEEKTFVNVFTTGDMDRMKIPATFLDDETLIALVAQRYGVERWVFISDTHRLGEFYASEDLKEELASHPLCEVEPDPVELTFEGGRHRLQFQARA